MAQCGCTVQVGQLLRMKRETLNHTKMARLCRRLNIDQWQAVGLLEMLWMMGAQQAPRGDIGRFSDEEIAIGVGYRGNETEMVDALVASGWIDRFPDSKYPWLTSAMRLVLHDWHEHCDDPVHMKLARGRQVFANGAKPRVSRLPKADREAATAFFGGKSVPRPAQAMAATVPPVEETTPPPTARRPPRAADLDGQPSSRFEEVWAKWPRRQQKDRAGHNWISFVTVTNETKVMACVERYLNSDDVKRGVCMDLWKFLEQQHRDGWEGRWPTGVMQPQAESRWTR